MRTLRHIGWCPVCERDVKVRDDRLVHHGYQRPGFGYIVGDCFGVGFRPYELSPEAAEQFLYRVVIPQIQRLEQQLELLPEATVLKTRKYGGVGIGRYEMVDVRKEEVDARRWQELLRSNEKSMRNDLQVYQGESERLDRLIADWSPKPLREVREEQAAKRAATEDRERRKATARDDKVAAQVAKYQQRIDSAVRRRNMNAVANIYESASRKLRELSNWELSQDEALAMLDRDHVWRAFGLLTNEGYAGDSWKGPLGRVRFAADAKPGERHYMPWPKELS